MSTLTSNRPNPLVARPPTADDRWGPRSVASGARTSAVLVASVGIHLAGLALVPALARPQPPPDVDDMLAFSIVAPPPEPEPAAPPVPEASLPPPPRPKATPTPDPPAEPDPTPAPPEDTAPPTPAPAQGTTDTVASHEDGLAVQARAGEGSGMAPTRPAGRRDGTPDGVGERPGSDARRLALIWKLRIQRRVERHLLTGAYPRAARRAGLEGTVTLALRIDGAGRIVAVDVARSSGHDLLDQAAVTSTKQLGNVPAPPAALAWGVTRPVDLPIRYRIP